MLNSNQHLFDKNRNFLTLICVLKRKRNISWTDFETDSVDYWLNFDWSYPWASSNPNLNNQRFPVVNFKLYLTFNELNLILVLEHLKKKQLKN